jgi:hypothetical protein
MGEKTLEQKIAPYKDYIKYVQEIKESLKATDGPDLENHCLGEIKSSLGAIKKLINLEVIGKEY